MSFKIAKIGQVPESWQVVELRHFLMRITYGFTNPMPDAISGPYKITAKDVVDGRINYETARRTSLYAFNKLTEKSRPRVGDLLLTKDGSIGRVAVVDQDGVCINQSVALLQLNENIDPYFLKYLLLTPFYQAAMENDAHGTTIKHIYITKVDKMEIAVPSTNDQRKIVSILKTLDDKIDLNRQTNQTLEATAQAIFKEWFVDFKFPDATGEMIESELGIIPKGWRVYNLIELVKHIKPGTNFQPKRIETGIPFLNVKNINKGSIDLDDVKYISEHDYNQVHKVWQPEENDVLISRIGTLGLVAVVRKQDLPVAVHYNFINIKAKDLSFAFIYFLLKSDFFQQQYHRIKKASVQEYVTIDEVEQLKVILPDSLSELQIVESVFNSLLNKILSNQGEITTLSQLKNTLLPKLMKGEILVN